MANAPSQTISPGHRRFVDVVITKNNVDPTTGVNTPTVDSASPLTFPSNNHPEAVTPSVDPNNNRRVLLTASPVFGADINWTVTVSAATVTGPAMQIPGRTTAIPDLSNASWGGSQGDA